ncbi:MAG: hypothetical protein MUP11_11500 [Anaerolineales bacterium]|nr:hypothetical protein [Anaerolineales bacterium]
MPKHNNQLHNQNEEKEKRAAELALANEELAFQNEEKGEGFELGPEIFGSVFRR